MRGKEEPLVAREAVEAAVGVAEGSVSCICTAGLIAAVEKLRLLNQKTPESPSATSTRQSCKWNKVSSDMCLSDLHH